MYLKVDIVCEDDMWDIFEWYNDRVSLENSLSRQVLTKKNHQKWFLKSMDSFRCIMLLGKIESKKVGVLRFDGTNGVYKTSINLNPKDRGRGYGYHLLQGGIDYMIKNKNFQSLYAEIKPYNIASIKIFERAGFRKSFEYKTLLRYEFHAPR